MNRRIIPIGVAALLMLLLVPPVMADTISLTIPQIATFTQLDESNPIAVTLMTGTSINGVNFSTIWAGLDGPQWANVGLDSLSIAFATGDSFSLDLWNTNENPWQFQLFVELSDGTVLSSAAVTVPIGVEDTFVVDLGTQTGSLTIKSVYFQVSGNLPLGPPTHQDRNAEYQIIPQQVPEPGTLLLLGTALICIGGVTRLRRR